MKYFFILGRNPALSVSELYSVLNLKKDNKKRIFAEKEVLIVDSETNLELPKLNKILGGTVKMGIILDSINLNDKLSLFDKIFSAENLQTRYLPQNGRKFKVGTSLYDAGAEKKTLQELRNYLLPLNKKIKKRLQEKELKVGFVKVKGRKLSSVSVSKNSLLEKGAEIVLVLKNDELLVGRTQAVQEFEKFARRDMGRPAKNKKSGIMPPKLARIMVNLSKVKKDQLLLDPFCGSGTIIQEAVILGIKNIKAADISKKAVSDTKKNIKWLEENTNEQLLDKFTIDIFQCDVQQLSEKVVEKSVDAVVTEPYLGPPMFSKPNKDRIVRIFQEVKKLYIGAFSQFAKVVKRGGLVVVVFPCFYLSGRDYFLEIESDINKLGFEKKELVPKKVQEKYVNFTNRNSIVSGEKSKFIRREIACFGRV